MPYFDGVTECGIKEASQRLTDAECELFSGKTKECGEWDDL